MDLFTGGGPPADRHGDYCVVTYSFLACRVRSCRERSLVLLLMSMSASKSHCLDQASHCLRECTEDTSHIRRCPVRRSESQGGRVGLGRLERGVRRWADVLV